MPTRICPVVQVVGIQVCGSDICCEIRLRVTTYVKRCGQTFMFITYDACHGWVVEII